MAWQFYGFIEHYGIHGPLPRKRWLARKGERYKLTRKSPGPRPCSPAADAQAEAYARWLAARDGVAIPEGLAARIVTGSFESKHRTRKRKFSGGVREVPFTEERPRAVQFCPVVEPSRRSYYRGVGSEAVFGEAVVTVALPNWDFDPAEPAGETLSIALSEAA